MILGNLQGHSPIEAIAGFFTCDFSCSFASVNKDFSWLRALRDLSAI